MRRRGRTSIGRDSDVEWHTKAVFSLTRSRAPVGRGAATGNRRHRPPTSTSPRQAARPRARQAASVQATLRASASTSCWLARGRGPGAHLESAEFRRSGDRRGAAGCQQLIAGPGTRLRAGRRRLGFVPWASGAATGRSARAFREAEVPSPAHTVALSYLAAVTILASWAPSTLQHAPYVLPGDQLGVFPAISALEDVRERPKRGDARERGKRLNEPAEVASDRGVAMTAGNGGDPVHVSKEQFDPVELRQVSEHPSAS
jgi:hypothetical protein